MLRIDLLPAEFGDAIWIEYGDAPKRHRLLIDCGTSAVFPAIRERILDLPEGERHFELLVVTHVDADHIAGAIELLRQRETLGLSFGEIWFNGYLHLTPGGVVAAPRADEVLGAVQGEELSELIVANGASRWNAAVHGGALVVPSTGPLQALPTLPGGMQLTLLSPGQGQLDRLKPAWDAACRKAGIIAGAATAADAERIDEVERPRADHLLGELDIARLAARPFQPDGSKPNGSSVALLAEYAGRRVLLTGDAYAPVVLAALARVPGHRGGRLPLDAVKLSHHGSGGNTSIDLVRALDCRNWLVSTNGKRFQHPDSEAIARVIVGAGPETCLHFNYRTEFNELWAARELQRKHGYATNYAANESGGVQLDLSN